MSNARRCGEEMTFRSRRNGNIHDHVIDADRDYVRFLLYTVVYRS